MYYKEIVVNYAAKRHYVSFQDSTIYPVSWKFGERKINIFNPKAYYIYLPASQGEYEAFWRDIDGKSYEESIRVCYKTVRTIPGLDREEYATIGEYKPNRHQRKHDCIWKLLEQLKEESH